MFFIPLSEQDDDAEQESLKDVTHIAFFDKMPEYIYRQKTGRYLHFVAKIELKDVYRIGECMKGIVPVIEAEYPSYTPNRFRDAMNQVLRNR